MEQTGRILIILGAVAFVIGSLVFLAGRIGISLGSLPGDIRIERGNFTCFFPLATSIILSVLLTVGLNLIIRYLNK